MNTESRPEGFFVGDRVTFKDKCNNTITGYISSFGYVRDRHTPEKYNPSVKVHDVRGIIPQPYYLQLTEITLDKENT